jgi:hypothetical protein
VIETRFRQHGRIATYNLTINGKLWACVEWSPSRQAWCVQDASGRCLAHCDAIHGEHIDGPTALQIAKAMIRDGRMPTPEEAHEQLRKRLKTDRLERPLEPSQEMPEPIQAKLSEGGRPSESAPAGS